MLLSKYLQILYKLFFKRLWSFNGRANRKEYVLRFLLVPFGIVMLQLYSVYVDYVDSLLSVLMYVIIFSIIPSILVLQYFPLAVRRLHDFNTSGWWILISFIPSGQLIILWLMFKKGTAATNKYGEPPSD